MPVCSLDLHSATREIANSPNILLPATVNASHRCVVPVSSRCLGGKLFRMNSEGDEMNENVLHCAQETRRVCVSGGVPESRHGPRVN